MATTDSIITAAEGIRDETTIGANTATRVGTVMVDTATNLKAAETNIGTNTSNITSLSSRMTTAETAIAGALKKTDVENIMSTTDTYSLYYESDIAEIYLSPQFMLETIAKVSIKVHTSIITIKGFPTSGPNLWNLRSDVITDWENGKVYSIKCNSTSVADVSVGDVGAYIVLRDKSAFITHDSTSDTMLLNLFRADALNLNPVIANSLAVLNIANGAISTVMLADGAVTTQKIADNAVTAEKLAIISERAISNNLLNTNDPDYKLSPGYYVNMDTGNTAYSSTGTSLYTGYTGFIPIDEEGLHFNAYVRRGTVVAGAVYDSDKHYLRALESANYTYQSGDGFVRWTLGYTFDSGYEDGQYMVNKGDTGLPYDTYSADDVISPEYLPPTKTNLEDGEVTNEKIANGAVSLIKLDSALKASIRGDISLDLPPTIYCKVGDTVRIYWRSIIKTPDPYIFDVFATAPKGKSYPRYYEITPNEEGSTEVKVYVKNAFGEILSQGTTIINTTDAMDAPASPTNILVLGASATATGYIAGELRRRLTTSDGTEGSTINPKGLNLGNISFVGRTTGSAVNIQQEATGGWSWKTYATQGELAYRFVVSAVNEISIGDKYKNNNITFTVAEINITEGSGNIRCTYSSASTPNASGTLTRVSGGGDATITYSSAASETYNPFWDNVNQQLDFQTYADTYCNGNIDIIISHCGVNDIATTSIDAIRTRLNDYLKPFVRAFHAWNGAGKFFFSTIPLGAPDGGFASSYGANAQLNYYLFARKVWLVNEYVREMASDNEFNGYFIVAEVTPSFDAENLYPTTTKTLATRLSTTEVVQSNAVHPIEDGSKTVADAIFETLNYNLS